MTDGRAPGDATDDPADDAATVTARPIDGAAGDGFDAFYRAAYPRVVVGLRLATGPAGAEDLAQEAFARTLARWDRVRHGTNPTGYVYRVAFRLHGRSLRRRHRHREALRAAEVRASRSGPAPAELWGEVAAVRAALDRLPPACRRAAVLCLVAEMSAQEAAGVLGVSASTVRTQLQRARQALGDAVAVADDGNEPDRGAGTRHR